MGHLVLDGVKEGAQGAVETVVPAALLSPLLITKESTFDEGNCLVIDGIVRLLCSFTKQVNNKTFYFVATKERHKDWTDKGDHDYQEGRTAVPAVIAALKGARSSVVQ